MNFSIWKRVIFGNFDRIELNMVNYVRAQSYSISDDREQIQKHFSVRVPHNLRR